MSAPLNDAPRPRHFPVVRLILAVGLVNFLFGSMINRLPLAVSLATLYGLMFGILRWARAYGDVLVTTWPKERPMEIPEETEAAEPREKATDPPTP